MSHDPRNVNLTPMPMPPQPPSEWDGPCANPSCACMRHETRVERAIRRQVAEEIAVALEARAAEWETPWPVPEGWDSHHIIVRGASHTASVHAAHIAREIGAKETS